MFLGFYVCVIFLEGSIIVHTVRYKLGLGCFGFIGHSIHMVLFTHIKKEAKHSNSAQIWFKWNLEDWFMSLEVRNN